MVRYIGARRALLVAKKVVAASSGGGVAVNSLFTATTYTGGAPPLTAASGVTFVAGVAVIGIAFDAVSLNSPTGLQITGLTGGTITATQIGTTVSDSSSNGVALFYAVITTGGTGSIILTGSGTFGVGVTNGWKITGYSSSTPSASTQNNGFTVQVPDPQGPIVLTPLSAGSVAVSIIGRNFPSSPTQNPTTWTGLTRDASAEAVNVVGNGAIISGATGSGLSVAVSVTASAQTGESYLYSGMLAAAWR